MKSFVPTLLADSLQDIFRGFIVPAPSPYTLDRNATGVTVANTTTETAIYSFTVPAFSVGQDQALRLRLVGDLKNFRGSNTDYTYKIKLGLTTMWQEARTLTSNNIRMPFIWDLLFANLNDTSSQMLIGSVFLAGPASPTTGEGSISSSTVSAILGTSAIDMTADALIEFTVTMSAADALTDIVSKYSVLEVV